MLARVNGSCLWLEIEVHRDGELWYQRYEFAKPVTSLMKRGNATQRPMSPLFTITLGALALVAPSLAQDSALQRSALIDEARMRDAFEIDRVLYDQPTDGVLWARGRSYKARFDANGRWIRQCGSSAGSRIGDDDSIARDGIDAQHGGKT